MNISKPSQRWISWFTDNMDTNTNPPLLPKTKRILSRLYDDMTQAYLVAEQLHYTVTYKPITTSRQITKPKQFNAHSFPEPVRRHIDEHTLAELAYTFSFQDRDFCVFFMLEEDAPREQKVYHRYIKAIAAWFVWLSSYAVSTCAASLSVYIYMTSLTKHLPASRVDILSPINVNTAFTTSCQARTQSEIVLFRREEWFKVLIHECFHTFGLDFSAMNNDRLHQSIRTLFPISSSVHAYEAYSEWWAELINVCFCGFYTILQTKTQDKKTFYTQVHQLMFAERNHSLFQLVKVLDHMGLTYTDLYSHDSATLRRMLYQEHTHVFAYYVLKAVLLHGTHHGYQDFLVWCDTHHSSLLRFTPTIQHQRQWYQWVANHYQAPSLLRGIEQANTLWKRTLKTKRGSTLRSELRMSICELV